MKAVKTKVAGPVASMAEVAGERVKDCVDAGVSACNAISDKARQVGKIGKDANGYIRARPWWAIGIAAGAGIVIGLVTGRRHS